MPKSGYLILGLLSFGETSGYDLKQMADSSVAFFYASPARSQIYTELRRLAGHGYATEREVEQDNRPDKRIYSITESGEEALKHWLENTPTAPAVIKNHLLLKVFLGQRMEHGTLIEEVRRYRDEARQFRARLGEILLQCNGEPGSLSVFLTTGLSIAHTHSDESWADEAIQTLEKADGEFSWSSDQSTQEISPNNSRNTESEAR